jgi:hypothetical protein
MKMILGMTEEEARSLDLADMEEILILTPGWMSLNQERQKEYRSVLLHVLENFRDHDQNKFMLMLLEAGARRFRGETLMQANVFNYVSPSEVDTIYKELESLHHELVQHLDAELEAKQAIARADAQMSSYIDFKWGRNDTEREAQSRENAGVFWDAFDKAVVGIKSVENRKKLQYIKLERIKLLRDLFTTNSFDIDLKDASPS